MTVIETYKKSKSKENEVSGIIRMLFRDTDVETFLRNRKKKA